MGKGSRRQRKPKAAPQKSSSLLDRTFRGEEDLDDEIDAFHKQRDVIPLNINADDAGSSSDDNMEEPVFDIEHGDDSDEDNDEGNTDAVEDDSFGSDGDDSNEIGSKHSKLSSKIARQAKFLQQRMGGAEDDMHNDEDESECQKRTGWGRQYFGGDNTDFELLSSDEEDDLHAEEEEALKLQREKAKSLSMKDFDLEDDDIEGGIGGEKRSLKGNADVCKPDGKVSADGTVDSKMPETYVEVKKDLSALSKRELLDIVHSSAPELIGILEELNESLRQLRSLKLLLRKVKENTITCEREVHYIEVYQHMYLTYCQALGFYLLLKSEGHSVRDHPVIVRLVEIKNILEKAKHAGFTIPSNIENYVNDGNEPHKTLSTECAMANLPSDTANLSDKACEVHEVVPSVKISKDIEHFNQQHKVIQVGPQSKEMMEARASLEEKLKRKGLYNRVKLGNGNCESRASCLVNRHLESLADFDDAAAETTIAQRGNNSHKPKLSQLVAGPARVKKPMLISGDDDLPKRDDIGERRKKHELRVLVRATTGSLNGNADEDEPADMDINHQETGEEVESEDGFYKEAKRQRDSKLSVKAEMYSRSPCVPPLVDAATEGKRHITYQMEKNKGLTRARKKITKIPRKKYKLKHKKALVRRKGQVRDIRKPSGPYGGEATGINVGISRSVRFKN